MEKKCSRCGESFPATQEHFAVRSRNGVRALRVQCRACYRLVQREAWAKNPDYFRAAGKKEREKIRRDVLLHYSGGNMRCACCGEGRIEFLALDHVDGGGIEHRKKYGGAGFYRYLRRVKYLPGLRVLCHNCNQSLGMYGYCPHAVEREKVA